MRFKRAERYDSFEWTRRKIAFASSRQTREAQRLKTNYPLIADQIELKTKAFDADAEKAQRNARLQRIEANDRSFQARVWRESRRDFFAATDEQKHAIRQAWLDWRGPLTPLYYRYVVDLHTGVDEMRLQKLKSNMAALRQLARQVPQTAALPF